MRESFTYQGEWFLPNNKDQRLSGTLSFDTSKGAEVEIIGSFIDRGVWLRDRDIKIILGYSLDGKLITLYECRNYHRSFHSSGFVTVKFTVLFILIGYHFFNESEITFNAIKGEYSSLPEWLGISGLTKTPDILPQSKTEITFEQPEAIPFQINDELRGCIEFSYDTSFNTHIGKATIEQHSSVVIMSVKAKPLREILYSIYLFLY